MTTEAKTLIGTGLVTVIIIAGGAFIFSRSSQTAAEPVDTERLIKAESPYQGPAEAKVTVVEFADFQCPACASLHPILKQLKTDLPQVKLVFRHFPLEAIHKNALAASLAAEAAGRQGKFWPMHDKLFEQQKEWSENDNPEEIFSRYAQELELDVEKFKTDMNSSELVSRIESDQADAQSLRILGTPTLFIGDTLYTQALSYNQLKQAIEARL